MIGLTSKILGGLTMASSDLEATIRTLVDIEEIKKLHARYTFLVDENKWDDVIDLFADDAVGEWGFGGAGSRGRHEGKKALTRFFKELVPKEASMFRHMVIQPIIEVEGNRAHAEWYMFGFGTYNLPEGKTPAWTQGKYENELIRKDGKWKFKHLKFEFAIQTPYHEGWVKRPSILPTVFLAEEK
jgi:hypothetical protein